LCHEEVREPENPQNTRKKGDFPINNSKPGGSYMKVAKVNASFHNEELNFQISFSRKCFPSSSGVSNPLLRSLAGRHAEVPGARKMVAESLAK